MALSRPKMTWRALKGYHPGKWSFSQLLNVVKGVTTKWKSSESIRNEQHCKQAFSHKDGIANKLLTKISKADLTVENTHIFRKFRKARPSFFRVLQRP